MTRVAIYCRCFAFACAVFASASSHAQDYPSHPVRVIVPFSPGGAVDGPIRVIAQEMSKRLGQSVVIENRPGAGATMGLLAPKGTLASIVDRLQREVAAALATSEVQNYMAGASIEAVGSTAAEFAAFYQSERDRWAKIIRETGAKVD
jgi:tripartite-type tricarboxylate transporter receptor subunit TctC